jgi:exodeoxyribonuclease VII large subunit
VDGEPETPDDRPVVTVAELNRHVAGLLEAQSNLQDVWLRGEVSNWSGPHPSSGHAYFRMKDDDAEIDCVMWRRNVQSLTVDLEEGLEVLAHGNVGLYEQRGSYQFYIDRVLDAGRGELYLAYQQRKRRLEEEGLFDPRRKQEAPAFPRTLGVVTSRSAAAFQDVLNVLERRSPHLRVVLADARVQGEGAGATLRDAIEQLNGRAEAEDLDAIVLTRGGGSLEDLWAFNEEVTVRAVADSRLPVITGVGHETDTTLADLAADVRAPTPSAAAEVAAPSREETLDRVREAGRSMATNLEQLVDRKRQRLRALADRPVLSRPEALLAEARQRLDELAARLPRGAQARVDGARSRLAALAQRSVLSRPDAVLGDARQRLADLADRLPRATDRRVERAGNRLGQAAGRLDALSPLKVLERGYAVATTDGRAVRSVDDVEVGDPVDVRVQDGRLDTEVQDIEEETG